MKYISPLKVKASKKKDWRLNLNEYRNTHFRTLNTCKVNYKQDMARQVLAGPGYNKVACIYTVYPKSKRSFDVGNVCCIHQKFFEDALVELGKLEDDNFHNIPLSIYAYGGIDAENPHVDVDVIELDTNGVEKIIQIVYNIINKNNNKGGNDERN